MTMTNFEKLYNSIVKEAVVGGNTGISNPTQAETQVTNPNFKGSTKPQGTTPTTSITNDVNKLVGEFFEKNKNNPGFLKTLKTMLDELEKQNVQQQANTQQTSNAANQQAT